MALNCVISIKIILYEIKDMLKTICLENNKLRLNFIYDDKSIKLSKSSKLYKYLSYFVAAISKNVNLLKEVDQNFKKIKLKKIDFNVTICGDYKIKKLNSLYRQKNKITDVLSFPLNDDLRIIDNVPSYNAEELFLGDMFICKSKTEKQAREFKITFEEELIHLMVHGFLHLLGYDHEISDAEEKLMEKYEKLLLIKMRSLKK